MKFPSEKYQYDADASTGFIFIRAYNKWHATIKTELQKIGITHPQFVLMTVLNYLNQTEEFATQTDIAKMADMDVMSVSQILRGLETKGYLIRKPNPKDTRANTVRLLEKGQEIITIALPIVEGIDKQFFSTLSDDERIFRNFLHILIRKPDNKI